jgi:hypothetical protein
MRTLEKMMCGGIEWTRLSVHPQLETVHIEGASSVAVCEYIHKIW